MNPNKNLIEHADQATQEVAHWKQVGDNTQKSRNKNHYQAMLDDTNNVYFYRIRSRDAAGRLTGHIVGNNAQQILSDYLATTHNVAREKLDPYLVYFEGDDALKHICRVATGLDSLVLGEPQILGQLKDAYHTAKEADTLNKLLEKLFQHAFSTAKKVRTDTGIGSSAVSVAYCAVKLSENLLRLLILLSTTCCKSSTVYKNTSSSCATSGSISLGIAISSINIGLCLRSLSALSIKPLPMIGTLAAVEEIIISASYTTDENCFKLMDWASYKSAIFLAFSTVLLATIIFFMPF
jgi:hypothetical protein